jgi:hypothetical protein
MNAPLTSKAIILNEAPNFYRENTLSDPIELSLPVDSEIVIEDAEGSAVRVILPDESIGYIDGETELNVITRCWATNVTDVYSQPNGSGEASYQLVDKQEFEVLNEVNDQWLRIRGLGRDIGYMESKSDFVSEDSVAEVIAESIGMEEARDKTIQSIAEQGVPRLAVESLYTEVKKAVRDYESSTEGKKDMAAAYSRKMLYGVLWVAGGIIATTMSMDAASDGGVYFIFWGAVVFGGWDILRGFVGWLEHC